jgi:hypothetical protein
VSRLERLLGTPWRQRLFMFCIAMAFALVGMGLVAAGTNLPRWQVVQLVVGLLMLVMAGGWIHAMAFHVEHPPEPDRAGGGPGREEWP